jgi:hypothetical protein
MGELEISARLGIKLCPSRGLDELLVDRDKESDARTWLFLLSISCLALFEVIISPMGKSGYG